MKRSDIIKIIKQHIQSITPEDIKYESTDSANDLLTKLEEAGMLPSGYEGRIATGKKYFPEMGPVDVKWFRGWEPEDETK
jgi:hypothetical protein